VTPRHAHTRLGVLSDLHLAPPGTPDGRWNDLQPLGRSRELTARALALLSEHAVDGLLLLGDLTDRGDPVELVGLLHALRRTGRPAWLVHGNHDLVAGPDPLGAALAEADGPGPRAATAEGERVAGIWLAGGSASSDDGGWTCAERTPPDRRAWPADGIVAWLSHHPVLDVGALLDEAGLPHPGDLTNRAEVAERLLARRAPMIVLCGHLHARTAVADGPVLQLGHASLIEPPHEVTLVSAGENGAGPWVRRRALGLLPGAAPAAPAGSGASERWLFRGGRWDSVDEG